MQDQSAIENQDEGSEARREWVAPQLKRLLAAEAEFGGGGSSDAEGLS